MNPTSAITPPLWQAEEFFPTEADAYGESEEEGKEDGGEDDSEGEAEVEGEGFGEDDDLEEP